MSKLKGKALFLWAVGQQESGGNYRAVNSGSGALGKWQVMPGNVDPWSMRVTGKHMTTAYFLDHDLAQDAIVGSVLGGDYDTYGPRGAAAVWYSGQPDWHATYGNPPVYVYVNDVMARMGNPPEGGGGGGVTVGGNQIPKPPGANEYDYSPRVRKTAGHFSTLAKHYLGYAQGIARLGG